MTDHDRGGRPLHFRELEELRREFPRDIAVERQRVRAPNSIENRKQRQGIFRLLAQRLRLLDEEARLLDRRLRFGRGIAFDVHQDVSERDLKLDLLAAEVGRAGQDRDLGKRPRKLLGGLR